MYRVLHLFFKFGIHSLWAKSTSRRNIKYPNIGKWAIFVSDNMKNFILLTFIFFNTSLFGQNKRPEDYGCTHLQTIYKGDTIDILIKSKKGEEQKKKPLFLFCQGSLPIPLIIKYDDNGKQGIYNVFVFNPDSLSNYYHLAIISKPYIPLVADQKIFK